MKENWPLDYTEILKERQDRFLKVSKNPVLQAGAKEYYKDKPKEFINDWMVTYDPRNIVKGLPGIIPFCLFKRQRELVDFLVDCLYAGEHGLIEKCRDMGATWICCAFSVWLYLFHPGSAVGWGSRKEQLVDKLGDPDSIFEKNRILLQYTPFWFLPRGFNDQKHMSYMKIINPETRSSVTGEAGDNIGRGGRKLIYFKDEAQPLYSKILTPSGWKTMDDMEIGSVVSTPNGLSSYVTNINNVGENDIYRIGFGDGASVDCSPNHLWTVDKVWGKGERLTLPLSEIVKNFKYVSPGGQVQYRYRVLKTEPVRFIGLGEYSLHPYIVGALLGDGSVNSGCVSFSSADDEIVQNIKSRIPSGCKVTCGEKCGYRIVDIEHYTKNSRARQAVELSGIAGKLAHEKFIPDAYKFGSIKDRIELLQGLMDTDGSASGGTCTYHTCSKQLSEDFRFLVQSLGGNCSVNIKPDHRGYRDMYCLHLTLPKDIQFFKLSRKNAKVNSRDRNFGKTIKSIEKVGRGIVRCISIADPKGLYLTDNCIVTHNSAHYERPEKIEAALGDNTDVQIDISSVNGTATIFYRRRQAGVIWTPGADIPKGKVRVFIMDWRDHPAKNQAWYDKRKAKAADEGLSHVFAQEVDRDSSALLEGVVIPSLWVKAAIDAHIKLGIPDTGASISALDVADGGRDRNALANRKGIILRHCESWSGSDAVEDVGETTLKAIADSEMLGASELQYDCIGVGSGVKSESNRLKREGALKETGIKIIPWDAGAAPLNPDRHIIEDDYNTPLNKDFYANLKAQGWWELRRRFEKTYRAVTKGTVYNFDELISLSSEIPNIHDIVEQLSQPTYKHDGVRRMIINKKPDGTKSPNDADAIMMDYWPVRTQEIFIS